MKLFYTKIFCFIFGLLCFLFITDRVLTAHIRHCGVREYKIWEDIFNSRIESDMIFLGSSKCYAHYNPAVFDSLLNIDTYNLGLNGKRCDFDIFRYNQYKKHKNKQPLYIVWDIMQNSFEKSSGYGDEQFMPYIYDADIWNAIHRKEHKIYYIDRIIPMLRYYRKGMIHRFPMDDDYAYKGYVHEYQPFDSKELQNIADNSQKYFIDTNIVESFRSTIKEMQNDGANVILVYSPFYYKGQHKIKDMQQFIQYIEKIADDEHCIFLNYLDSYINQDSALFKNATHLNSIGADIFSSMLSHDLDSIFKTSSSYK